MKTKDRVTSSAVILVHGRRGRVVVQDNEDEDLRENRGREDRWGDKG